MQPCNENSLVIKHSLANLCHVTPRCLYIYDYIFYVRAIAILICNSKPFSNLSPYFFQSPCSHIVFFFNYFVDMILLVTLFVNIFYLYIIFLFEYFVDMILPFCKIKYINYFMIVYICNIFSCNIYIYFVFKTD